jgi:hypothetical protein
MKWTPKKERYVHTKKSKITTQETISRYGTRTLPCHPYARRWSEPVDLLLALSQAKLNWSLAAVEADNDSATYDMEAQCGAGGTPKSDLLSAHTRLWRWPYARRWSEPVDLPLALSQLNWSLAAVEADNDSATYDMQAQCGAGGQPKSDLLSAHTRLWRWPYARRWSEPVDLPLVLSQTKLNWSLAAVEADNYSATYDMQAQCGAGGMPNSDHLRTHMRL